MKAIQKICFCFAVIILFAANANAGRWLTRDPIAFMERDPKPSIVAPKLTSSLNQQINLYRFVDNNPINEIDPLGLSPADVIRLTTLSQSYTSLMTQNGQRLNGGDWNNFMSSLQRLRGNNNRYLGCGQQADALAIFLNGTGTDDQWLIYNMEINIPDFPGYHQLLIAQSSNPNDPLLYLDPWNNTFGPHPPTLFYLGPITPSVPVGGGQNSTLPIGAHPGNGPYITP